MNCTLCASANTLPYHADKFRQYLQCQQCHLVFVDPTQHLSPEQEKAIYDLHQNDPDDIGYRKFLNKLAEPLTTLLHPAANGLDYGCGPGPVLSTMLVESGFNCVNYDPLYANETALLSVQYDFVTCTEVVEHFNHPGKDWPQLLSLVKPGGLLAIMTKRVISQSRFANWHYKNDQTHVSFFSDDTFSYLARASKLEQLYLSDDVIIFRRL